MMAVADGDGGGADGSAFLADPCAGTAAPAIPFVGLLSSSAVAAVAGRSRQRYSCPGATRWCHGGGGAGSAAGPDRRRCHRRWAPSTTRCPTLRGWRGPDANSSQPVPPPRGCFLHERARARISGCLAVANKCLRFFANDLEELSSSLLHPLKNQGTGPQNPSMQTDSEKNLFKGRCGWIKSAC